MLFLIFKFVAIFIPVVPVTVLYLLCSNFFSLMELVSSLFQRTQLWICLLFCWAIFQFFIFIVLQ